MHRFWILNQFQKNLANIIKDPACVLQSLFGAERHIFSGRIGKNCSKFFCAAVDRIRCCWHDQKTKIEQDLPATKEEIESSIKTMKSQMEQARGCPDCRILKANDWANLVSSSKKMQREPRRLRTTFGYSYFRMHSLSRVFVFSHQVRWILKVLSLLNLQWRCMSPQITFVPGAVFCFPFWNYFHINDYLVAKIGFDTAESEPCKVCQLSVYRSFWWIRSCWTATEVKESFNAAKTQAQGTVEEQNTDMLDTSAHSAGQVFSPPLCWHGVAANWLRSGVSPKGAVWN